MRTFDQFVLPLAALILAAIGGAWVDRVASARRKDDRDCGDFWARAVMRVSLFLALPVFASGALSVARNAWISGYHLQFDLTGVFGWPIPYAYRAALLLPFGVWALLLSLGVAEKPRDRDAGRWLAGAIGFGSSRRWVLVWTIPLAAILVAAFSRLGGGAGAYPAAAWSSTAVLLLSLIGVALSRNQATGGAARKTEVVPAAASPLVLPWPEALGARGVQVRPVASWPATGNTRNVRSKARDLLERLRVRGARGVAPEMVEAIEGLLGATTEPHGRSRLIFAPDDCGQSEAVALAAELLDQRFHAATLVITANDADALAAELGRWLPAGRRAVAVGPTGDVDRDALIVVTDAQTLSDRLLPQLKNPLLLERFGFVAWWHLEAYTGVLAANLWAISRRLHRLFDAMGRHDLRTLAFVRSTPYGGAQLAAFVRRLLPHPMPVECEVHVEPRFPRAVHLHLLESHHDFFARGNGDNVSERYRHLPLVAAKVSVEEGWRTRLEVPPGITDSESHAFLDLPAGDALLREQLEPNGASASARVRSIEPGEVLSLVEIIRHGGRAGDAGLPHHVGVTLPANPYAAYLLSRLASRDDGRFQTSRRLVSAAAQPGVVRRHLLLALDELPDTRSGLLRNFLWNEKTIHQTLDEIAHQGKLTRREVRFLNENGELQREHEYRSQRPAGGERRPLDTVGAQLVEVRDAAAGYETEQGVRMRVDPERVTIQAYPHRVFVHAGQRYRINEWSSSADRLAPGRWLECSRDDVYSVTWRIRNASVFGIESNAAAVGVGGSGKISRLAASLTYAEEVVGRLRVAPDLTSGADPVPEKLRFTRPVATSFMTRALILRMAGEQAPVALASVAGALRHLLPVHLGVEEDALEVVPLTGEFVQNRATSGLAIVDLYPGGIGLVDAISDDDPFLLQLLGAARDWLAACPCRSDEGCPRCLRSPAATAANMHLLPLRSAALDLLRQAV